MPPSVWFMAAALTSLGCLSATTPVAAAGVALALLVVLHMGGMLSYGLSSWGLRVLSTMGEALRPRLALRRRSAARDKRPVSVLSFSLRPRLWLIELRANCGCGGAGISRTSFVGLALAGAAGSVTFSSSSSITISMTPDPCETPDTMEFVLGLPGR
jgi:hypothetical protein